MSDLRKLAEAATPGPWEVSEDSSPPQTFVRSAIFASYLYPHHVVEGLVERDRMRAALELLDDHRLPAWARQIAREALEPRP